MIQRKKIAIIIENLDVGGAEMDIVRNYPLINKTHEIVILLYSHRGKLAEQVEKAGVRVITMSNKQNSNFIDKMFFVRVYRFIKGIFFLRSHIKSEKVDIVHAFLPWSYIAASLIKISMFGKKPLLIMSRLSLNFYRAAFLEKNICHRFVDIAVGNSNAILKNLKDEGVPESKLFLLYNGIDVDKFKVKRDLEYYTKAKIIQITSIGNLFTYKGHGDLLQALKLLKERRPDLSWYLNIVGRDEHGNLKKYQKFIQDNNLVECINFVGPSNDVFKFLQKSHLHIHPSHTEGLPNSIIEAMSSSLACIATNVGGIPELIEPNKTGLIVPSKSSDELSVAIEILLDDRQKLYHYGITAQKKASSAFSVKHSVARYLELYKS